MRTIAAILLSKLEQRFPNRGLQVGSPPGPCAVFPAVHADIGDIQIYDDGDEVTLVAGNFTHGHFSDFDDTRTPEQKAERIAAHVVSFLDDLFADRVVLWGAHDRAGGWYNIADADSPFRAEDEPRYVWSGLLSPGASGPPRR